jgi:hypothetical protein
VVSVFSAKYFCHAILIALLDLGARIFLGVLKEYSVSVCLLHLLSLVKWLWEVYYVVLGEVEVMIAKEFDEVRRKL